MSPIGDNIILIKEMFVKEKITHGDAIFTIMNTLMALDKYIDELKEKDKPVNLLQKDFSFDPKLLTDLALSNTGIDWVDGLDNVEPTMDVGLKLWLCTTNTNKSYFAHALDEDQARVMVDEIYGEDTVINVFNYDNQFQVMREL